MGRWGNGENRWESSVKAAPYFKLEGVWKEGRDALSGEEEVRTRSNAEK